MSNNGAEHQEVRRIPDMDGTGPRWLGERRFSRRGRWNFPDNTVQPTVSSETVEQDNQPSDQKPVYGIGRGGLPRGCGRKMSRRWN